MPRKLAVRVLERVLNEGAYSHIALDTELDHSGLDTRDKGLATQLVYGTLTMLGPIDRILDKSLKKGVKRTDASMLSILRVAVYQLLFLDRIPAHAAINSAVELAREVNPRASGFVNGVLRSIDRDRDNITWWSESDRKKKPVRYLSQRYGMPSFVANRLVQQLGFERAEKELFAMTMEQPPPLWARWRKEGDVPEDIASERSEHLKSAIKLQGMSPETRAFLQEGALAVQDVGSQLVGKMCGSLDGMRALDTCAGLGGKSLHLLDAGAAHVTSVEPHGEKLNLLSALVKDEENKRFTGTVQEFASSYEGEPFDLVLVDAPCTGLGVLRRHPEGKERKREADIGALAKLQAGILSEASQLVKPGGVLVYAVCSFTREEGSRQVERFLEAHPEFEVEQPPAHADVEDWSRLIDESGYLRTWPGEHNADAFFAVRMRHKA